MYIVIQFENHPDRIITDSYGPFASYCDADVFVYQQMVCDYNSNYNYRVVELTSPNIGE
jgi:hypothetical protein